MSADLRFSYCRLLIIYVEYKINIVLSFYYIYPTTYIADFSYWSYFGRPIISPADYIAYCLVFN